MKKWIALSASLLATSVCFADGAYLTKPELVNDGFFIGLGANYNSLNLTQNSFGLGISNIVTSTGANSNGVASGNGAPFNNISNSLAPGLQFGYLKHLASIPNYFAGVKFSYQYIGATTPNNALFIPQIGSTTSAITGVTSPLFGYVTAASVQPTINHEVSLLALFGRSFGNATLYVGAGPSLVNMKSKNYNTIGYAIVDGATVNVTGLITYASPSIWAWGGTAQLGASYFFSPTWFVDMNYSYTVTGSNTFNHQQGFTNSSVIAGVTYSTSGTIITKNTISVKNQALMLSINKLFDF